MWTDTKIQMISYFQCIAGMNYKITNRKVIKMSIWNKMRRVYE